MKFRQFEANLRIPATRLDVALLALRIASGLAFLYHGAAILFGAFGGPGPERFAIDHRFPVVLGYLIGLAQVVSALAVLLGAFVRLAAAALIVVMLGAIFLVHLPHGFDVSNGGFEYALTQLLIAFALLLMGAGSYSVGSRLPAGMKGLGHLMTRGRVRYEMPLSELVRTRRATDNFSSEPVPESDLQEILRAGLEAPSSYNLQPWRFVVVRDRNQRKKLRIAALDQQKVEEAPLVIVACGDTAGWSEDLEEVVRIGKAQGVGDDAWAERKRKNVTADLGSHPNMPMWVAKQTMIAATTMMWMAESLGYDTGPMEGFDEEQVRAVLKIPLNVRVLLLLAVGHLRGEDSRHPGRLSAVRTVFSETYGQPFPMKV